MARVLNVKDEAVTAGVLDKGVDVLHDQREITYVGDDGTPYTIFVHRNGPFADPEAAIKAHREGRLHPFEHDPDDVPETPPPAGPVFQ